MSRVYVIECRTPDGLLDFDGRQPEEVFGASAITGITEEQMARVVYARLPGGPAMLDGRHVAKWPALIDPRWNARRKTW